MEKSDQIDNIIQKISRIEDLIHRNNVLLDKSLGISKRHDQILFNGIAGYIKDQQVKNSKEHQLKVDIYATIRNDKRLRYPHNKIIDFLSNQFNYEKQSFNEIHFSKIVKECRIGKNMAKGYLDYLVEVGYLEKRDDGYRVWYKIKGTSINNMTY